MPRWSRKRRSRRDDAVKAAVFTDFPHDAAVPHPRSHDPQRLAQNAIRLRERPRQLTVGRTKR
jgi:hypothetical protein